MTQFTVDSLEQAGTATAQEFWEDDLETALEPILARLRPRATLRNEM